METRIDMETRINILLTNREERQLMTRILRDGWSSLDSEEKVKAPRAMILFLRTFGVNA